jgi:hypothetical protein
MSFFHLSFPWSFAYIGWTLSLGSFCPLFSFCLSWDWEVECWINRNSLWTSKLFMKVILTSSHLHNIGNLTWTWFLHELSFYTPRESKAGHKWRRYISSGTWKQNQLPKTILAQVITARIFSLIFFFYRCISLASMDPSIEFIMTFGFESKMFLNGLVS